MTKPMIHNHLPAYEASYELDAASRALDGTDDNEESLAS